MIPSPAPTQDAQRLPNSPTISLSHSWGPFKGSLDENGGQKKTEETLLPHFSLKPHMCTTLSLKKKQQITIISKTRSWIAGASPPLRLQVLPLGLHTTWETVLACILPVRQLPDAQSGTGWGRPAGEGPFYLHLDLTKGYRQVTSARISAKGGLQHL